MHSVPLIDVYYRGSSWSLIPGGDDALSYYGGPLQSEVSSRVDLSDATVHHVATLNLTTFGIGVPTYGFSIPLLYAMCHEGCVIQYRKTATSAVEITFLDPVRVQEGCPYYGYPTLLPYYRLGIGQSGAYKPTELKDRLSNTAWKIQPECLYAVVMEHPGIGHCLFYPETDVEIAFEYDPEKGRIRAAQQAT